MKNSVIRSSKIILLSLGFCICLASLSLAAKDSCLAEDINSLQAYDMVTNAKEGTTFLLDVRTPEEYQLIGHAPMAYNIPVMFLSDEFVAKGGQFRGKKVTKTRYQYYLNPDFVAEVAKKFKKTDTLLVTCRSGNRSVPAVNLLVKNGFTNVYNIRDGVEGGKFYGQGENKALMKKYSTFYGHRNHVEGWKFYGLPYTYHMNPKYIYEPHIKK
ncbi:MAG: rhodanese-like domain-containing protein [Pseudomonadota bacterium]|nr:rhodanese-like domain-containing protein [Pseudomonadota bacterium]